LPIAIDRMTVLAAAKRPDRIVRLRSLGLLEVRAADGASVIG
jgi:hypothetical protein